MKSIYKYEIPITEKSTIQLPVGAQILSLVEQGDKIVVYCLVPIEETEMILYEVLIFGTGEKIVTDLTEYTFLGTVGLFTKSLVVHAFYKKLT